MKIRKYLSTLSFAFSGLLLAPLSAQDTSGEVDTFEEPTETTADESADDADEDSEKKSKKKKKKKSKKSSKSKKDSKEAADEKAEKKASDESAVVEAFGKFKNVGGKLNKKADFFIYLVTSSTCVHCQRCMPVAIEQYKKMKARKVELIIIDADTTEEAAKKYLKSYKLKNPCIMFSELQATNFQGLPGCGMPLPPSISVVSKDGNMIKNVVGATQVIETLNDWRNLCSK
ncbi:MAG: redoxin domain-containing protein [Akkermansiaceae bacterium]|nr:redoxin domain-containing protein [Akkermansiaceae bacterium]